MITAAATTMHQIQMKTAAATAAAEKAAAAEV
jgi:hypothetical protein